MFNEPDPVQMRARDGRMRGMLRMDPLGETMFGLLHDHDAVAAANAPRAATGCTRQKSCRARSPSGRSSCGVARSRRKTARGCGSASGRAMPASCGEPARRRRTVTTEELVCDGVPALRVVPPDGAARGWTGCRAPARRVLHDGLGGGRDRPGVAPGGGHRRLGAGPRLPAGARARVSRGAGRCRRRLRLACPRARRGAQSS